MAAGIYYSDQKPENAELYMKQFVDEMNEVFINGGLSINGFQLSFRIHFIICDRPARTFIKGKIANIINSKVIILLKYAF